MLPREILKKIRRIEITTRKQANELFAGEYQSIFKGRGMEFSEVREYMPGDDIRSIDWNVTARMGYPYVKKFREERELTVILAVDLSASGVFGTVERSKNELAAEVSAVLAFTAVNHNDKVGLMIFTDKVEKYIPPKKGRSHILRLIREILFYKPEGKGTDIGDALDRLNSALNRRSVVFLISDFMDSGYEKQIGITGKRHDLVALRISDPREMKLSDIGLLMFQDAETGEVIEIDTSSKRIRKQFENNVAGIRNEITQTFKKKDVDYIDLFTGSDYSKPLVDFFRKRAKRNRWGS
ncbi:MAG: DUF58 domain-containing protein [candidate division Zixibacteria bacterium]|nr:DUF58 domain-containing protein [candidate division Zixibacteria bacterium]